MSDLNSQHNRVVWIDIPVADLDRANAFYAAVLGISVTPQQFEEFKFSVLEHQEGNGGCLVPMPNDISDKGIIIYLNVAGRLRDAVAQTEKLGGKVLEPIHAIGPHGFRALILDSEGNRVALHSMTDA
jgi:predicted enzyme related to lactoylglutathione lyase